MSTHADVSNDTHPNEALTKLLMSAQSDHRQCVSKALADKADIVDRCALTWVEVEIRYAAWAAYRPTFYTEERESTFKSFWTPKTKKAFDQVPWKTY